MERADRIRLSVSAMTERITEYSLSASSLISLYSSCGTSLVAPSLRKGTSHGASDFLSDDSSKRNIHLLSRGGTERCAYDSLVAWASVFVADVRAVIRPAVRSLSPRGARLSGFRSQRLAGSENICVHVRSLRGDYESFH